MNPENVAAILSLTGTVIQCAVATLTVLFFLLLSRYTARRPYFTAWTNAWILLLVAVLAIVVRYHVVPVVHPLAVVEDEGLTAKALYFVYDLGKLLFAAFLVYGVLLFREDPRARRFLLISTPLVAGAALLTVILAGDLNEVVAYQAALLTPAFAYCGWMLLRLPAERRTLGTQLVGGVFFILAFLWFLYFLAFSRLGISAARAANPYALFTVNNSFIDALVAMVLTMGMVVMLMEDARRETERLRSERQAEAAHAHRMETVGQLVSGIAHELNNPLAAVLSFSELLLHEDRTDNDRAALSTIREQARRCRNLVRNLLTFVREGGIRCQPVIVGEVVDRAVRAYEPELAQFGISCEVTIPPDAPLLMADPEALEQVFTNLLSNGIHAVKRFGLITIVVRNQGETLEIMVEDNGPGIPEDIMPRIFDPFFSGSEGGRAGLGLSVTRSLLTMHGGTIEVTNRPAPDQGARVLVKFPVFQRDLAAAPVPSTALPSRAAPAGRRVLLIEDERSIRAALRRYFERNGWRVDEAEGAIGGLDLLLALPAERGYDLVVSDLRMPDMSGIMLHDRLKQARPDLLARFIFITGDVASPEVAAFLASTTCPVLEKPFELSALSREIGRFYPG